MINRPKGTKDVTPQEVYKWQYVENVAKSCLENLNFKELRTPTFEHTELFVRGVGEGSDIVNKEMYTFLDKGERSITLKPEGTASIVRAVIENGLDNEAMPLKLYMLTPCFRYERPQAGRLREHHQFSIEAFGSHSPMMDAEVIGVIGSIFDKLNFKNYKVNINSIGCPKCRKEYLEVLKRYYSKHIDSMCEDCKVRYQKNALRLLDCKDARCAHFKEGAPKPREYLCEDCKDHFNKVRECLDLNGVNYVVNDNLVRGIDYYTRTVFEFLTEENGALGVICGGGRYDGLVSELGGKDIPGVGVGLGIERILSLLEKNNVAIPMPKALDIYIANASQEEHKKCVELAVNLRQLGLSVEFDTMDRSLKAQMKYANKIGASYVMIIGEQEVLRSRANLKSMTNSLETEVGLEKDQLGNILKIVKNS